LCISIDGDLDQYVSQGVGVSAHTIELFIGNARGLLSEEFATPRERKDALRGLMRVALPRLGARQVLHSHRATDLPGHGIRSAVPDTATLAASGTLLRLSNARRVLARRA
jgi:hypothetical protein